MTARRSPVSMVAWVTAFAAILLALTLPDREPQGLLPCPAGHVVGCVATADHRVPERVAIILVGLGLAAMLFAASRRLARAGRDLSGPGLDHTTDTSADVPTNRTESPP